MLTSVRSRTLFRASQFLGVLVASLLAAQSFTLSSVEAAPSVLSQRIDTTYQANGPVNSIVTVGSTTYLGGDFTSMRPAGSAAGTSEVPRAHLAAVDNVTGALLPWNPGANGSVYALAASPDKSILYVGGIFSILAGSTHKRIGAVTPDTGAAVASFAPSTDGKVYAIAATAGTVYLGGTFSIVNSSARSRAAAVTTAGAVLPGWAPVMNDSVRAITLSPDGSWVYVAGEFSTVNGLTREKYLTKLSPTTASISLLSTHPGYPLWSVVVTADSIFVGGNGAGGHASEFTTGGVQRWKFQTDGGIQAVYLLNGVLYVGGHFDNVCTGDSDGPATGFHCPSGLVGATRHKLVAVVPDASTTLGYSVDPWDPGANSALGVFAFASNGASLQVGGEFTTIAKIHQQAYGEFSSNQPPVASFTSSCTGLTCSFNARASTDSGGPIAAYTWNFGDGTSATGATATHSYAKNGSPAVTLTVTDNEGALGTQTKPVTVASALPTASFTIGCPNLTCTVDGSSSSDPDGAIAAYAWTFGDGATAAGATATHSFDTAGTYSVTLTVTDNSGGVATASQSVDVTSGSTATPIAFVGAAATNKSATTFAVAMPAAVQEGDELLLTVTNNNATIATQPAGWQEVGRKLLSADGANGTSTVWHRTATAADVGPTASVTVTLSGTARAAVTLVAYRGVSATAPVAVAAAAAETVTRAAHTTPSVTGIPSGALVVSYWADRASTTTAWTPPPGEAQRVSSFGAAGTSAHVDALVTDSGNPVPAGSRAGLTATADSASGKAAMWTLVLAPDVP